MKKVFAFLFALVWMMSAAFAETADHFLIIVPGGAPAIAVSGVYAENPDAVQTVGADTIAEAFGSAEADFIIAPVNAGAKLFKAGKSTYRLAAVVTWGNLVFASRIPDFSPEKINGHKLVLFGENTINAAIAAFVLEQKGIVPSETEYLAGASETQALLLNSDDDEIIVMTAEPAVTAAKIKDDTITSVHLNELYQDVTGYDGFPQAGLFVKAEAAEKNPETIRNGLEKIRASVELCENDPETTAKNAVNMEVLAAEKVALLALPGCSIRYMDASEAREQIEKAAETDLTQFGGELPADDFYYDAD